MEKLSSVGIGVQLDRTEGNGVELSREIGRGQSPTPRKIVGGCRRGRALSPPGNPSETSDSAALQVERLQDLQF